MTQIFGPSGGSNFNAGKYLENIAHFAYGHSFGTTPAAQAGAWSTGGDWPDRLSNRMGTLLTNRHVGGSLMSEVAMGMIGTQYPGSNGVKTMGVAQKGIVTIEAMINEIAIQANVGDSAFQAGYKNSLRAAVAMAQAGSRIESSTATQTAGSWATISAVNYSAGSEVQSKSVGAILTFSNVSAPAGYIWLLTFNYDSTAFTTSTVGTIDVQVDGVSQGLSFTGVGGMKQFVGLGSTTWTFSPHVIKIPVSSVGTHTIKVLKTDSGVNAFINIDALIVPSTTPPPVFIMKDPPNNSSVAAGVGGTISAAYSTYAATYNAMIDAIVTEFAGTPVYAIDLSSGWNSSTMVSSIDTTYALHPNDLGQSQIAATIAAGIEGDITAYSTGTCIL